MNENDFQSHLAPFIDVSSGSPIVTLPVGTSVQFNDATGQAILRIDDDGTLHGLTGQSLAFDL